VYGIGQCQGRPLELQLPSELRESNANPMMLYHTNPIVISMMKQSLASEDLSHDWSI